MPMPDFVIIGAQKSASTFVQRCLAEHPHVDMLMTESEHFEDPGYGPEAMRSLEAAFASSPPSCRRGIKRPDYLGRAEVPQRLARHLPAARLIAVLRSPVKRAISAYYHYASFGMAPLMEINAAFVALLNGSLGSEYPRSHEVLTFGLYAHHLQRYRQYFPPEQLGILLQDELAADPLHALRQVFALLDVDVLFNPPGLLVRSNVGVYSPVRLRLQRTKVQLMYDFSPDCRQIRPRRLGPVRWLTVASLTAADRYLFKRFLDNLPGELSAETSEALNEYYSRDLTQLEHLLERDLGGWR